MILVNSNTRQFNIPGADLVFGVTDDSDVERKHFQCPRYVGDNLDLAACFIRINYRNANGKMDFYLVDDLEISGDNITFSWLLSPRVTEYRGQVKFVMCAVGPDLKLKWHTTQGTGQVMEGLEPDNSHVESQTADVVAQLIAMVGEQTAEVERVGGEQVASVRSAAESARMAAVNEIEAKRANSLASIPNDYTTLSGTVESLARGRGGAIVCEVEDTAVSVDDASDMAIQGMRIFGRSTQDGTPTPDAPVEIKSVEKPVIYVCGKNLLKHKYSVGTHTINGLNFTVSKDGSVTLNGTPTASAGFVFETLAVNEPIILTGCPSGGTTRTYRMTADCYKNDVFAETTFDLGDGLKITPDMADYVNINVFAFAGTVFNNLVFYPMVRLASDPNPTYEPYKTIQTIETANPIHGIPLISSSIVTAKPNYIDRDGNRWVCDEVDLERGVYIQRVKKYIMDGTLPVVMLSTTAEKTRFDVDWIVGVPGGGVMCDSLRWDVSQQVNTVQVHGDTGKLVLFVDKATNPADFHAYLAKHPITVLIQTAPVEIPLSETELAAYRTLRSNYKNTTVLNDAGAHMAVKYAADTKLYIDKKIKEALQ